MLGAFGSACGKDPGLGFFVTADCGVCAVAMFGAHGVSASVERRELDASWMRRGGLRSTCLCPSSFVWKDAMMDPDPALVLLDPEHCELEVAEFVA